MDSNQWNYENARADRIQKISAALYRSHHNRYKLHEMSNRFTIAVREELGEPKFFEVSDAYDENIDLLRRAIRDDEKLIDELSDNVEFIKLFGAEGYESYRKCTPLRKSTKIIHGIAGHYDVYVRRLKKGDYLRPRKIIEYDDFCSDYIKYAYDDLKFHIAFVTEVNELYYYLGKLQYRTSFGQNVLQHSKEVSMISAFMARELGVNVNIAKRAGLLHDIGKSIDRETEGTHTQLSVELVRKHRESRKVQEAIASHHMDTEFTSIEGVLVQAADSISAARPGARREIFETYIKRLEKLEELSKSFDGVNKAYALRAGREVRVIINSNDLDDNRTFLMSKDIAKKIQEEVEYPGQIKVTVIREVRAIEYAK